MANICQNYIEIEASAEEGAMEELKDLFNLVGKEFDFNKVIPCGESRVEAISAWGCSSIAFDPDFHEQSKDCFEWSFWTKWTPPYKVYEKICELFPKLFISWEFEENGCGLNGNLNGN